MSTPSSLRGDAYVRHLMTELNRAQISSRLKTARTQAGLRQKEAADLLEVHENTIQNWERGGEGDPTPYDRITELARLYNVEPAWVLHGDDLVIGADRAAALEELLRQAIGLLGQLVAAPDQRQSAAG